MAKQRERKGKYANCTKCTITGCEDKYYQKGLCEKHYWRVRRNGHPDLVGWDPGRGFHFTKYGYKMLSIGNGRSKAEHTLLAEKALGRPLPSNAEVHHVDGNPANNTLYNLVICPDHTYHALLEKRTKALKACGNANYSKCSICKKYDDPKNILFYGGGIQYHRICMVLRERYRRSKNPAKKALQNSMR